MTDEILYWTGAGKWHLLHHNHAACNPDVLLLRAQGRRRTTLKVADLCGRCFPGSVARRRLHLVR